MNNFKINLPLFPLIIVAIFIFVFTALIGGTMPYFILYIFLFTLIIPLTHNLLILRKINGSIKIPKGHLFTGERINIDYNIENNSILPIPYLEIQSNILKELTRKKPTTVSFSLEKKESYTYKETIFLGRRGFYKIADMEIIISDVFGFYSFKKTFSSNMSLIVYPEPINISTFQVLTSQQSGPLSVENLIFQDKNKVTTLRDYRDGDSVKSIHWKLSAKTDGLIVKEYDNSGGNNVVMFLDNHMDFFKDDVDRRLEDKIADISLSIVNYCLNQNIKVDLKTDIDGRFLGVLDGDYSDLKSFLDILARFKGDGSFSLNPLIMKEFQSLNQGSTIIIITPNLDKEIGSLGVELKTKFFNPIFITIEDLYNNTGFIDSGIKTMLRLESIPVFVFDYTTSIKEALEVYHG